MGLPVECERASRDLITLKDEGVNFGGTKSFNFSGKMLMVGDFNLNSIQGYSNSLREVLKQTVLSQEVTFRKQVHELHRVYRIQKDLMEYFGCEELYGNNLLKARMQSAMGPFSNPTQFSPLANGRIFAEGLTVGSTQYESKGFLEKRHCGCLSLRQRSFDLQPPAKQYVNHVSEDLLDKRNGWDWKEPLNLKHQFTHDDMSFWEEVKLTLSIGRDTRRKDVGKRIWSEDVSDSSAPHVIDLEKPTETVTNEDATSVSICAALTHGVKHHSQISIRSNQVSTKNVKKDSSFGLAANYSLVDCSKGCEEQNSFSQGFNEQNVDFVCNDMFAEGKPSTSHEAIGLDLNRVPFDVSSQSNDPTVTFPSKVGSSGAFDGLMGNDHESSGQGSIDFLLKSPERNHAEVSENRKGVEDGRLEKSSPTSCKFDCIADDSSSGSKTMQSGTDLGGSNISIVNHRCPKSESSQVVETRSDDNEKEESSGGDIHILIQEAVESLLHFSSGSSTGNQDSCTKAGSNEAENGVRDQQQPQHSLDSYESMVLKLTESSGPDDCCVSSKAPFEINESDGKDFGIKLRRGRRRLKDFQKDILPAMASLSKHEIREDLNIMETVIRSREYKRMRSKMAGGGNWFTPIKSRRSRLNHVGRRYHS